MTKIKRYDIDSESGPISCTIAMVEHPQGEWVRWEDVKELIQVKPRAMTSEDILKGMGAAIRGESNRPGALSSLEDDCREYIEQLKRSRFMYGAEK